MANLTNNQTQSDQKSQLKPAKNYSVNIAGDISPDGVDIGPIETQADEIDATRESLKSATGQSTLGQEAGKKLVNPIWEPVEPETTVQAANGKIHVTPQGP